ncbi:MAG: nitrogenase [Leptolyngbyaceae cyanobacterium SU_3_3]|nr:nitrogenase [Leptolyngbyaceae cyanobacterium SU_3_3]NJR49243.1 nitrogenase [Leptolyngbyaceae cyanobacterium CSU_1_3]
MSTTPSPDLRSPPAADSLAPIRRWLDRIEFRTPRQAHRICKLIPCTCPFERKFTLFGHFFHTPPLCEFNPFYNEFVALRLRALTYLADVCGEDVEHYIC